MTKTKTFTAVVSNSPLSGPNISITDESGYVLLWLDVPGLTPTLTELVERLRISDFTIAGEWRASFRPTSLDLVVEVRSDREL